MKHTFQKSIAVIGVLFLLSFSKEKKIMPPYDARGNSGGAVTFNMSQIDGVFSVYHLNYDYGSVLAPDTSQGASNRSTSNEYWKYVSSVFQNTGDTVHKINAGTLLLNSISVPFYSTSYSTDFSIAAPSPDLTWHLSGTGGYSSFDYLSPRSTANYTPVSSFGDTLKLSNGLDIDLGGLYNSDSVYVAVSDFNQASPVKLMKKTAGTATHISFNPDELATLTTNGGRITVTATNLSKATINSKNYLFCSATMYIKLINFKP